MNWWDEAYEEDYKNHQTTPRPFWKRLDKLRKFAHVSIDYSDLPISPDNRKIQKIEKNDYLYIK